MEVAVASGASHVVTQNIGDFGDARDFGLAVVTPAEYLGTLGEFT